MKIVCVCHEGNTRSVCMARELKYRGHSAAAIGIKFAPREGLMDLLCGWADKIIYMEPCIKEGIPEKFHPKTELCDVGRDRYYYDIHPELWDQVKKYCNEHGL